MTPEIKSVQGLEILDSRGRPTIKVQLELEGGIYGSASVPSGASTGASEALELRDGGPRYDGLGCLRAVENVNNSLRKSLKGQAFASQEALDQYLVQMDGSPDKSKLGANAILGVSLAFARACAQWANQPLYQYFSKIANTRIAGIPRPTINLFSGGKHGGAQVPIQDLLIVPMQDSISKVLECAYSVFQAAAAVCLEKYQMRLLTADEGGLAPPFASIDAMFEDALEAIEKAGFTAGKQVMLAVDVASSQFYHNGEYQLGHSPFNSIEMIDLLDAWTRKYPIISLEDGLAEEDWQHWPKLCQQLGDQCLIMGDDFLCTNPERISKAVSSKAANALLLKVNQIGTVSEAMNSLKIARNSGWKITISARSGETEDNWLADLAVGWQGDYIKIGSITQSERLAKYNRLLEIEQEVQFPIKNEQLIIRS